MGSLCCVAARPHVSQRGCGEWSVGPNESHCRTTGSFSPPLSRRWDYRFHPEAVSSGSHGLQFYESSMSSTSKRSRSRMSSGRSSNHQYSASDDSVSNFSSPSDSFHAQRLDALAQGVNLGEFVSATMSEPRSEPMSVSLSEEGCPVEETSTIHFGVESSSSYSDAGDSEQSCIVYIPSSRHSYSGQYPFVSKPVHPIIYTGETSDGDIPSNAKHGSCSLISAEDYGSSSQRSQFGRNSTSSLDFVWHQESPDQAGNIDRDNPKLSGTSYEDQRCALCEKWLFQKSPWGSHRMVRSTDMPVAGVLSCSHVYHAECLEQTTPKSQKHDPPCPLCAGGFKFSSFSDSNNSFSVNQLQPISIPANEFPMFRITADNGSSRGNQNYFQSEHIIDGEGKKWGMQMPPQSSKSFLSKTHLRKHFSFKGKSVKEWPAVEHGPKGAGGPVQVYPDQVPVGCSRRGQYLRNRRDTPVLKYHR
ncbi:uncharacterized protein LOC131050499 isoform X2 [Cryptomeria japonica]|uniref:uncharacterized protein LOC131050499 isoform X2 n=1 Tax=Cryptomeria japonica TaxID=3369 RepID=UPI0025AB67F0|nr:uncharacterized protein LOC131050499 isoform X2 [Cryptomeria japonica]